MTENTIEIVQLISYDERNHTVHLCKVDHSLDLKNEFGELTEDPYAGLEPACGAHAPAFQTIRSGNFISFQSEFSLCKRCAKRVN